MIRCLLKYSTTLTLGLTRDKGISMIDPSLLDPVNLTVDQVQGEEIDDKTRFHLPLTRALECRSFLSIFFFFIFLGYFGNLDGHVVLDRPICSKMAKVVG